MPMHANRTMPRVLNAHRLPCASMVESLCRDRRVYARPSSSLSLRVTTRRRRRPTQLPGASAGFGASALILRLSFASRPVSSPSSPLPTQISHVHLV